MKSSLTICRRKIKHVLIDSTGIEECPILDIQISRSAYLQPLKLAYLWSDFHETLNVASLGGGLVQMPHSPTQEAS